MADNLLDDPELGRPGVPDFRRIGKGAPFVVGTDGKRTAYGRPSNAGKILDDESNLEDWKRRTIVYGASHRPDLMAKASTLDPQAQKNELRDIAEECLVSGKGKERAVKGEAVHLMFDHLDRQDGWIPAPQWQELCDSYLEALTVWGLIPVDIEVTCINDEFRLAGKLDRRYGTTKLLVAPDGSTIPIGSVLVGDTKTGAALEYASGSYSTQLAGYAGSERYNVETDERTPFSPPTFQDWGLVIHADSSSTNALIYWVDLKAGREGLQLAQKVRLWRRRNDLVLSGAPPSGSDEPAELAGSVPEPSEAVSLANHTRARILALREHHTNALRMLQREWPVGVPGLKQEGHSMEQLQAIIKAVEKVEAEYMVPFFQQFEETTPRPSREVMARHPSNAPREQPTIRGKVNVHPRRDLILSWIEEGKKGGIDETINALPLQTALLEFASIDTEGWSTEPLSVEEQLSQLLMGTLRAMGYKQGLRDLGHIDPSHVGAIFDAASSIVAGTAMLLYGEDGKCILRTNIVRGQ